MADSSQPVASPGNIQHLTWKLLDGCASELELLQLADGLAQSAAARRIYLECVELHVGLLAQHGGLPKSELVEMLRALPAIELSAPPAAPAIAAPLPPAAPLAGHAAPL